MISHTISIRDNATPAVQAMLDRCKPDALNQIAGRAGANTFRTWFRNLNTARPNAIGGKRTNFYGKAATAVGHESADGGAVVYTQHTGVNYQRYGGVLKPSGRISAATGKPIRNLIRAASPAAHGRLPSEFGNLTFAFSLDGGRWRPSLVQSETETKAVGKVRKDGTRRQKVVRKLGEIMYWLMKQAKKDPDDDVFPPSDLVRDNVQLNLLQYVVRNARRLA